MKYYLGRHNKKGNEILDTKDKIVLKNNRCLQNIDYYTSNFNTEEELKLDLMREGIIDINYEKIDVVYTYEGRYSKLPVVYKSQKRYLNKDYIKYKVIQLQYNISFLTELAKHYDIKNSKFNNQFLNVNAILMYLSDVRSNGGTTFESKALSIALDDMVIKAIYRLNKKTGEFSLNYRGLRDLGLFIYRFEEKQKLLQAKQEILKDIFDECSKDTNVIERFPQYADVDGYPGDLEKWNTDSYVEDGFQKVYTNEEN